MIQMSAQNVMTEYYPPNWIAKPKKIVIPIFLDPDAFPIVGVISEISGDLPPFQKYDLLLPLI